VVGRRVVPLLVTAGRQVTALTRRPAEMAGLRAEGARVALADVYDADVLAAPVRSAAPTVVLHQLTDLRGGAGEANARIRAVGTRNLVDAALAAGARRMVAQSISWACAPGERPATEATPLHLTAPAPRSVTVAGVAALEDTARELPEWVVLRYGLLYGPGTWYAADGMVASRPAGAGLWPPRTWSALHQPQTLGEPVDQAARVHPERGEHPAAPAGAHADLQQAPGDLVQACHGLGQVPGRPSSGG
jgi:nucleoside-diphosphate-sugar epimerase